LGEHGRLVGNRTQKKQQPCSDFEWRSFEEARAFVRKLGLKGQVDWYTYCASGKKPKDIPITPPKVYADTGWINWGDWLGTGRQTRVNWRSFKDARSFVRGLGLKSPSE
jgi:hypothetical protein